MIQQELKKYRIADDGSLIRAATAFDLVSALRDSSKFASDEMITSFMRGFAKRYKEQTGLVIRDEIADWFIADLIACGYLTEVL